MERVNIMSGLADGASLMHRYTYAMTQTDTNTHGSGGVGR